MRYVLTIPMALSFLGALPGCGAEKPVDSGDPGVDTDVAEPECEDDEACDRGQICVTQTCEDGDRDNAFPEAAPLFQETPVDGEINPAGDVDYYAYASKGEEWLRIETTPDEVEGGLDTVVTVYDAGGGVHAVVDDFATGTVSTYDTVMSVWLPTAGTWYVSVQDLSSYDPDAETLRGGRSFDYTLNVKPFTRFTEEVDAADDPSAEIELADGTTIYAVGIVLESPGDVDWVDVSLPYALAPLEIYNNGSLTGSQADLRVQATSPAGDRVLQKDGLGPDGPAAFYHTEKGTYSLAFSDAGGGGSLRHWGVAYVRTRTEGFYDQAFDVEPNNTQAEAVEADLSVATSSGGDDYLYARVVGRFDATGDSDWYVLEVPDDDTYVTSFCTADSTGSLANPAVAFVDASGDVLATGLDGDDLAPDLINGAQVAKGEVWFQFTDEGDFSGPGAWFACTIYLTPFEVAE